MAAALSATQAVPLGQKMLRSPLLMCSVVAGGIDSFRAVFAFREQPVHLPVHIPEAFPIVY